MTSLELHPNWLTEMAYGWCSVVCENDHRFVDCEILILSLEIGFRHINLQGDQIQVNLTHTEHPKNWSTLSLRMEMLRQLQISYLLGPGQSAHGLK